MSEFKDFELPPRPQSPLVGDCCGNGCTPCVMDIHEQELKLWQQQCERIQTADKEEVDISQDVVIRPDGYTDFLLTEVIEQTPDTNLYKFALPDNRCLPIAVGQHLVLRWVTEEKQVSRQYTPICSDAGSFTMLIKIYPDGEMSKYIRTWQVGCFVEWRGPVADFTYQPNQYAHVVLLAAGTGIAPMIPLIRNIVSSDTDDTIIHLLYTCRKHFLAKQMLNDFSAYWNFSVTYFTTVRANAMQYGDKVIEGRITQQMLVDCIGAILNTSRVLVCGTKTFEKDMLNYLRHLGVGHDRIHKF